MTKYSAQSEPEPLQAAGERHHGDGSRRFRRASPLAGARSRVATVAHARTDSGARPTPSTVHDGV